MCPRRVNGGAAGKNPELIILVHEGEEQILLVLLVLLTFRIDFECEASALYASLRWLGCRGADPLGPIQSLKKPLSSIYSLGPMTKHLKRKGYRPCLTSESGKGTVEHDRIISDLSSIEGEVNE